MNGMFTPAGAVSVIISLALIAALGVAYLVQSEQILLLVIGAIIADATTVVNFYLGSSSGSARKTELLAQAPPITPPP